MKKRFLALGIALVFSVMMLFAGCGEGVGAEDTGEDGKVGKTSVSSHTTTTETTRTTTTGNMMDKAEDLVEDMMPDGNPSTAATTSKK